MARFGLWLDLGTSLAVLALFGLTLRAGRAIGADEERRRILAELAELAQLRVKGESSRTNK